MLGIALQIGEYKLKVGNQIEVKRSQVILKAGSHIILIKIIVVIRLKIQK